MQTAISSVHCHMHVKIESERLRYIKFYQAKLCSEEYTNLRDAIIGSVDTTNDINNIGTAFILPSSYIGSPRHMQEYIQDAMTYSRTCGRPDLLSHLSVIQTWDEIKNLLLFRSNMDASPCYLARVFKQ